MPILIRSMLLLAALTAAAAPAGAQEPARNYWNLEEQAHTEEHARGLAPDTPAAPPAQPSGSPPAQPSESPPAATASPVEPVREAPASQPEVAPAAATGADAGTNAGTDAGAPGGTETGAAETAEPEEQARSVDELYRRGERARRRGDKAAADRLLRAALERAPYHFLSLVALGRLHLTAAPSQARESLETARRVHPSADVVHYLLGQAYEGMGRELDAAEAYRQAIYLNPRHYDANQRLRGVLRRMRAGRTVVERAAESFHEHPSLATLTLFGRIVMEQTEPRQAALEFEDVRRRQPELPEVDLWLARARHAAGDSAGEIAAYRSYLQRRPTGIGVRLLLVERLAAQGWYQDAAELLRPFDAPGPSGDETFFDDLAPSTLARVNFLRSRLLSARGRPAHAGEMLLLAHRQGYPVAPIEQAFAEDLALFPDAAGLWFAYGNWLRGTERPDAAAEALTQAGRRDANQRRKARSLLRRMRETETAPVAAALALGELAWVEGDGADALAQLAAVPAGDPLDHRAALLRGLIHRQRGELEQALDAFARYIFFFEDRRDMTYARGNVFWQLGRRDEALAIWNERPEVLLRHPDILQRVAELHATAGDEAAELSARERLAQALPGNQHNRVRLGDLYERQGRPMEAVLLWERVLAERPRDPELLPRVGRAWLLLNDSARALPILQRAAQLRVLDDETSALLARELYRAGHYEEALRAYWELYRAQPTHPGLPRALPELALSVPVTAEQRVAAARLALQAGRLPVAAELFEAQLNELPHDAESRMALAEIYVRQERPDRAEAVLTAPGEGGGLGEEGLRLMADVQERLSRKAPLAETLERLHRLRPDDAALTRRRALLLTELHRPQAARPLLEQAVSAAPRDVTLRMAAAAVTATMGDAAAAETHLRAVLNEQPDHVEARRRMIELLLKRAQWEDAAALLERWVADNPRDAKARYNLVTAYLKLFRPEAASPHYRALQQLHPLRARALEPYFR